jgi:hypothetical protein
MEVDQLRSSLAAISAERDAYLRQRDIAIGERNEFLRQRDVAIGERNELRRQIDTERVNASPFEGEPSYQGDFLATWHKSVDFLNDPKFMSS